jgi:hypothetical protein
VLWASIVSNISEWVRRPKKKVLNTGSRISDRYSNDES